MARTPKMQIEKKLVKAAPTLRMKVERLEDIQKLNPIISEMIEDARKQPGIEPMARFSLDFSLSW